VSKFIDLQDVRETLPLHRVQPGVPYYIGFFLMGAYQDIMGDFHNLFGRVNEAHIYLDDDEECGWYIEETIEGSTIASVLNMTQWDEAELNRKMKAQVDAAIRSDRLKPAEAIRMLNSYERALKGYTYLQLNGGGSIGNGGPK
jgi:arginine decarboxylase